MAQAWVLQGEFYIQKYPIPLCAQAAGKQKLLGLLSVCLINFSFTFVSAIYSQLNHNYYFVTDRTVYSGPHLLSLLGWVSHSLCKF